MPAGTTKYGARQVNTVLYRRDRTTKNNEAPRMSALPAASGALLALLAGAVALQYAHAQQPSGAPRVQGQNPNGMHVYLWGGLKSHGPGQHDYPQFLADWSKVLTEHGAVVDGAFHPPSNADLQQTDVIVIYKGDAAYLSDAMKET